MTFLFAIPNQSFALRADNIRGNVNITGWLDVFQNFTAGNAATDTSRFNGKVYFSANGAVVDSGPHTFLGMITPTGGFGTSWFNGIIYVKTGIVDTGYLKVHGTLNQYGAAYFSATYGIVDSALVTFLHGATIGQDTNNVFKITENGEDFRLAFANNRVTINTSTAAILDLPTVGRLTGDWATIDTLIATYGRLTGIDYIGSDTLTDGTMSIIAGNLTAVKRITADYISLDTLTAPNGATIMNDYSDTLSITETNVKINGKLNSSGDVIFKAGGQLGDTVGDTYAMYGWLDWGWREIADPAVHGEAVRCAQKFPAGITGTQYQAGFFATQNKYSTPAVFLHRGLEGKATASAPTQYIQGLRGGIVAKDSGTCDLAVGVNAYNECLSGATIDTAAKVYLTDIAWAGTVTVDYGILHRTLNTIDVGIYHDGAFTADFDASDNDFTVAGEIVGDTITTSYLKLDGNILSTVQARGSHFTITIDGSEYYLAKDSTFFSK